MAFSCQYNNIIFLRFVHSISNRFSPVFYYNIFPAAVIDPFKNVGNDVHRCFCSGIIRCNHRKIRQFYTDSTHNGPLYGVSVATAAENCDEPALAEISGRAEHIFQSIRSVRIVQKHCIRLTGCGNYFNSAPNAFCFRQSGGRFFGFNPQLRCNTQHTQRVVHRKPAGYAQLYRNILLLILYGKENAVCIHPDIRCMQVCGILD